ncbi:response regulator [Fulvivirga maritima]|uniref:response regulator n=1 Tax=Fulvivirga maritima TaxID=2904247 RepID=UPI001F3552BC|nr:response regulator [Fulvivirga maritima]UII26110.1 response regulator [Fulvivirga maritima]
MERIKILIVEDELLIAEDLKMKLEDHQFIVLDTVDSGEEALLVLQNEEPDLILMDIHLAGDLDGIETADIIQNKYQIPVIYLSDHTDQETVDRAKTTRPVSYLSKPFKEGDLLRTLELAFYNATHKNSNIQSRLTDRILVRTDNQSAVMINYNDILYLEANRAYSYIITENKKYILSNSLKTVFDQFESDDFVKVSRSYVININHITGINGNMINLGTQHSVQMSSQYREMVINRINVVK